MRYLLIWLLSTCALFAQTNVKYALPLVTADSVAWTGVTSVPDSVVQGAFTDDSLGIEIQRLKGIYLDLPYLYNHNTKLIATCEADEAWTDNRWDGTNPATHADDVTNYKVGSQGISITTMDNVNIDGIYLDFADKDLSTFSDGSASSTSDYIELSLYISDVTYLSYAQLTFNCDVQGTTTNGFKYINIQSLLSNGWNHLQLQKSAFAENGSPDWSSIKGVDLRIKSTDGTSVTYTIDAIRMTRKDPIAAKPNPFQIENDGVMERLLELDSGVPFLGYDGTTLVVKAMSTVNLNSTFTFDNIEFAGTILTTATTGIAIQQYITLANSVACYINNDDIRLYDGTTPTNVDFAFDLGDEVTYNGYIRSKSLYIYASKDGLAASNGGIVSQDISGNILRITLFTDVSLTAFRCSSDRNMIE